MDGCDQGIISPCPLGCCSSSWRCFLVSEELHTFIKRTITPEMDTGSHKEKGKKNKLTSSSWGFSGTQKHNVLLPDDSSSPRWRFKMPLPLFYYCTVMSSNIPSTNEVFKLVREACRPEGPPLTLQTSTPRCGKGVSTRRWGEKIRTRIFDGRTIKYPRHKQLPSFVVTVTRRWRREKRGTRVNVSVLVLKVRGKAVGGRLRCCRASTTRSAVWPSSCLLTVKSGPEEDARLPVAAFKTRRYLNHCAEKMEIADSN